MKKYKRAMGKGLWAMGKKLLTVYCLLLTVCCLLGTVLLLTGCMGGLVKTPDVIKNAPRQALSDAFQAEQGVMKLIAGEIKTAFLEQKDCKAGLAAAELELSVSTSRDARAAAAILANFPGVDGKSDLYLGCYGTYVWTYWLIVSGVDMAKTSVPYALDIAGTLGLKR